MKIASIKIAFVGGGNMATAFLGGLTRNGHAASDMFVIEPQAEQRARLERDFGVQTSAAPDAQLKNADIIVLSVKPQQMKEVCSGLKPFIGTQLLLSIAAGVRADDLARWLGTRCIVRAMPNTPALIGKGVTGLIALDGVNAQERSAAAMVLTTVGSVVWVEHETQLDAVTAVSGSGPAYVFFFMESLLQAARELGLSEAQARALVVDTFTGAAELAAQSKETLQTLRERVTSKGGTTAAALASLEQAQVKAAIARAVQAANQRAEELGDEFGRG